MFFFSAIVKCSCTHVEIGGRFAAEKAADHVTGGGGGGQNNKSCTRRSNLTNTFISSPSKTLFYTNVKRPKH